MRKKIIVFDVDDTLVVTESKIYITNTLTGDRFGLTTSEFAEYKHTPHDMFDFSDFRNVNLLKAGRLIEWVFNTLKRSIQKGIPVGIITARDNSNLIIDFLEHNDVHIDHKYIFAVNEPDNGFIGKNTAERKKEAFIKLIDMGFTDFTFYDDDENNINIAKTIPSLFNTTTQNYTMQTHHIKDTWVNHKTYRK
jgi:hydroxymethylpyrimidine pyrophosphatase-like HAD family hydrolase